MDTDGNYAWYESDFSASTGLQYTAVNRLRVTPEMEIVRSEWLGYSTEQIILAVHMSMDAALIVALLLACLFLYLVVSLDRYQLYLKISAIGAIIAVAGLLCVFGMSHVIPLLPQVALANLQRMLSGGSLYTAYGAEATFSVLGVLVLAVLGMISQEKYVRTHTDESGTLIIVWPGFRKKENYVSEDTKALAGAVAASIKKCARNAAAAFSLYRWAILKGAIILGVIVIAVGIGVGLFYGGREIHRSIQYQQDVQPASRANDSYVNEINALYGSEVLLSSEVTFVGAAGDGSWKCAWSLTPAV